MEDVYHLGIKGLIRNAAGEILLLKVNPNKLKPGQNDYWDLPGGRVQKDSTVAQTLQREIQEETGIDSISNIQEVGMVLSNIRIPVDEDSVGLILGIYSCEIPNEAEIEISDEHLEFKWFSPKQASELLKIKYPQHFCEIVAKL